MRRLSEAELVRSLAQLPARSARWRGRRRGRVEGPGERPQVSGRGDAGRQGCRLERRPSGEAASAPTAANAPAPTAEPEKATSSAPGW